MLNIEIRFQSGTYHATPWDRQVNEGAVEWPPSSWRILRALIFTWYHKAQDEVEEQVVRDLIEKMSVPPIFHLPPATLGHTRHYMPLYNGKTTKIFDTFASIEEGRSLYVKWPEVELTEEEGKALDILLNRLGYLGRAESWAEARLTENIPTEPNSIPLPDGALLPDGYESIRTLVCTPPDEYRDWREKIYSERKERRLSELRAMAKKKGKDADQIKLKKSDEKKISGDLPEDLFAALHVDTRDMKRAGWSQPPGSMWIDYTRPRNAFDVMPRARKGRISEKKPTAARFAVASQAPPRLTDAISLADRIHVALVSRSDGSPVFTGRDDNRKPLRGHKHTFILCESNLALGKGRRGEITHVTVYAPMGFTRKDRLALDGLTKVWGHGGHDVQLILLGVGQPEDFGGLNPGKGACPILVESPTWVSRTPFIPTRHPKATRAGKPKLNARGVQIGSPEHELERLLRENGFPEPIKMERTYYTDLAGHETRWLHFRRERKTGSGTKAGEMGYGFRIEFHEPVRGPIALGYGAHFGLGLFVPHRGGLP